MTTRNHKRGRCAPGCTHDAAHAHVASAPSAPKAPLVRRARMTVSAVEAARILSDADGALARIVGGWYPALEWEPLFASGGAAWLLAHAPAPLTALEHETLTGIACGASPIDPPSLALYEACGRCDRETREGCSECGECAFCMREALDVEGACEACSLCGDCCTCLTCDHCDERVARDDDFRTCSTCDRCAACCHCSACSRCGERIDPEGNTSFCSDCDRCGDCCECERCSNCGDVATRSYPVCADCARCSSCGCADDCRTNGDDDDDEEETEGRLRAHQDGEHRLCGLEVEYTRASRVSYIRDWADSWGASHITDGSCGWECVTAPSSGVHLARQLRELTTALDNASAGHDTTCGVHVHVDARDLGWQEIRRLALVYARVEPFLYLLAGQHRASPWASGRDHNYSKPNGVDLREAAHVSSERDARAAFKMQLTALAVGCTPSRSTLKRQTIEKKTSGRYVGLNLAPWVSGRRADDGKPRRDTTVEFRLHRDCHDFDRLHGWALLCTALVDWAAKASEEDLRQVVAMRSQARALLRIAPSSRDYILKRVKAWRRAVPRAKRRIAYAPCWGYTFDLTRPGRATIYQETSYERGSECAA